MELASQAFLKIITDFFPRDWNLVKQLSESYPCVIPCIGLHLWYVAERTTITLTLQNNSSSLHPLLQLERFQLQVNVFRQQLELANELKKPASIQCVRAFGDLLQIMKPSGPFPAGVILHSYLGSAEMVPEFAILVPSEKILLEIDASDALPKSDIGSLHLIEGDASLLEELQLQEISSAPMASASEASTLTKAALNHPVLIYVASLLEMTKEGLSEISYHNALRLFPYYVRT